MVKRKLATLTVSTLLIPASALALGLGNISMNSALDQQLQADIPLHSVTSDELSSLTVRMASGEMFEQYGLERPIFLDNIKFDVIRKGDGAYIKLTSSTPVKEPFLNFLVEATWPNGHVLRQFTVLVDPPTMMQEVPVQVMPVKVTEPKPRAAVQRSVPVTNGLSPSLSVDSSTGAINYGPSKANDTLWGVAKAMRGDRDVTIHQMMLAILRDNPDAFYRNNVNNLKMGYVLRINDPASIASISAAAAQREIARQYNEWKSGNSFGSPESSGASASADAVSIAEGSVAQQKEQDARLKLVAAGSAGEGTSGVSVEGAEEITQALAIANERLLANSQEASAMNERLVKLEEQIQTLKRLVELKDSQLASIQQEAAKAPEMPAKPAEAATPTAPKPAAAPKPVAPAPEPEVSLFDNPMVLGGIVALFVLLLGLGFRWFQRRKQSDFQESILTQTVSSTPATEVAVGAAAGAVAAGAAGASTGDSSIGGDSSLLTDFSNSSMNGLQSDIGEIDPISEADVYLAYGRYTQAEDIITDALQNDPTRAEYHVKLLEIYHSEGEKDKFLEAAQNFHSTLDGNTGSDLWIKASVMGKELLPGNALFDGSPVPDADVLISNEALSEAESLEQEQDGSDAFVAPQGEQEISIDIDELNAVDVKEDNASSDVQMLDESSFSGLDDSKDQSISIDEPKDDNHLDFDLSGFDSTPSESSADEVAAAQQLNDEIADNSLDFGADLDLSSETTPPAEEEPVAASSESVEEPSLNDEVMVLDATDDNLLDIEAESGTEVNSELQSDDFLDLATELDEKPVDSTEPDNLLDLSGELADLDEANKQEAESEGGIDLAADLEDMANMLDQSAGGTGSAKNEGDDLASMDLSDLSDLDTSFDGDFDDDNPFADLDEVGTKLDLARAYVEMGDKEGAQGIIDEVMQEGNDEQKQEAQSLLDKL